MEDNNISEKNVKEEKSNEIVEIDENEEITATQYDLPVSDTKKKAPKKSGGHKTLSRKAKIVIIIVLSVLLVIGIGLIFYFLLNKDKPETDIEKSEEDLVIVEKDNYRFQNGNLVFKEDDKDIGEYTCKNNNEVLCYVAYFSNEDTFDVTEKVYESGIKIQNRSDIYNSNYVFVYDNETKEDGNLVLYDIKEKKTIGEYKLVKELKSDKAIVKDTEDNYHILVFGDEVKDLTSDTYDYIGYIIDSEAIVVADNNNYKLLDLDGESLSKEVPGQIKNFDKNNISVLVDKEEFVYDYNANKIIDKEYDYIRFVDDYIIAASNKKLYVYDAEGNPMIIDGIKISSNKYNTRLIYGTDLKQNGRESAFDAYVTGTNLRIEYGEDYQVINLNEGVLSKSLKYINYFQGKLYFYSNEDKTNLIGTYTCKNANVVSADTKELKNCYVATESNILEPGDEVETYLPIYNKRFVFINDVDSTKRGSIVLYDLANSKEKASYLEVDAGYHEGTEVKLVETAGTIVAAKNTSGSYGVINIGTNDVTSVIKFRDETDKDNVKTNVEIKYMDKYLLVKRSDGTYHLYDTKGKYLTSGLTTSNEIVGIYDKYVMVKNSSNKYLVYGTDGTIVSLEYKYIVMTDLVYVAINDSNKIEVYKYTDKNTNFITEDINVDNTNVTASVRGSILTINYTSGGEALYQEINIDEEPEANNG